MGRSSQARDRRRLRAAAATGDEHSKARETRSEHSTAQVHWVRKAEASETSLKSRPLLPRVRPVACPSVAQCTQRKPIPRV